MTQATERNPNLSPRGYLVHHFVYGETVDTLVKDLHPADADLVRAWIDEHNALPSNVEAFPTPKPAARTDRAVLQSIIDTADELEALAFGTTEEQHGFDLHVDGDKLRELEAELFDLVTRIRNDNEV